MENCALNSQQAAFVETVFDDKSQHCVLFGGAGTGKSVVLHEIVSRYKKETTDDIVILGPTGLSISKLPTAQTISTFLGAKAKTIGIPSLLIKNAKLLNKKIKTIVIDECGMISAGEFTALDQFLRCSLQDKPFGGVRLILIGDVYQLQPTDNFFFTTKSFQLLLEQGKIHVDQLLLNERMSITDDEEREEFLNLLNSLRIGSLASNARAQCFINYTLKHSSRQLTDDIRKTIIHLCSTNNVANKINAKFLECHEGDTTTFFNATGDNLTIKPGVPIQLTQNIYTDGIMTAYNGMLATIQKVYPVDENATGEKNGVIYPSVKSQWACDIVVNDTKKELTIYSQISKPKQAEVSTGIETTSTSSKIHCFHFRLAFAVTIHKMQGQTLDNAILVGDDIFEGRAQMYVAFSRMRNWRGLYLKNIDAEIIVNAIEKKEESNELKHFIQHFNLL